MSTRRMNSGCLAFLGTIPSGWLSFPPSLMQSSRPYVLTNDLWRDHVCPDVRADYLRRFDHCTAGQQGCTGKAAIVESREQSFERVHRSTPLEDVETDSTISATNPLRESQRNAVRSFATLIRGHRLPLLMPKEPRCPLFYSRTISPVPWRGDRAERSSCSGLHPTA
jgi:hypothetical protein